MAMGAAKSVGASAVYPYSKVLEEQFTFASKFDPEEKIELFRREGSLLHLPRRVATTTNVLSYDQGIQHTFVPTFEPRSEEQMRVVGETMNMVCEGRSGTIQAPTGFGKTVVGCMAIYAAHCRTLIVVTKEDIIEQWTDSLQSFLNLEPHEIGIWRGDQVPTKAHKVVVALVQSVSKGPDRYGPDAYKDFGMVICDEVHRMGAETFSQTMWWLSSRIRLGLSATPERKDGREIVFKMHIGEVEVTATMEVMIPKILVAKSGWKVPRNKFGEPIKHKVGRTRHLNPMFENYKPRNDLIERFVRASVAKGRIVMVFCDSISHIDLLGEILGDLDVGKYYGLANYSGKAAEKKAQREAAKNAQVILCTAGFAGEATNIPWADTAVLAVPKADVVQIVGRIRREYEGKKFPVVLDITDSDSPVFKAYARKREKWYKSLNCQIVNLQP